MSQKPTDQQEATIVSQDDFLIESHVASAMAAAHWHNHLELNLLLNGRMTYLFNGRQEHVEANRLVLFWAAIPHQTIDVSANAVLICIYLPLADFLSLPVDRGARRRVMQGTFLSEPYESLTDARISERWVQEWDQGDPTRRELAMEEVKLRIRRLILDTSGEKELSPHRLRSLSSGPAIRHVEVLTELINRHYAEPLTVPQLVNLAAMHPTTANKAFRQVLGISVNEYLIRYRIARAIQLLADTEEPILSIAYGCGFGSSSRFYEVFRKRTGNTPRAFRRSFNLRPSKKEDVLGSKE
ncbi:helix-turn-helix domain-containing protein [Mesorhizobium sp. NPDC059054]|uniref:helix-turn-helix domain-containing protein n=1 Tax=Mesorhizobium sp. NPDC059054 TaxID=3346711 RepID=UPI00369D030B